MNLRLSEPGYLLLLVALIPMAAAAVAWLAAMTRARRWISIALRALALAALSAALAGATLIRTSDRLAVIAVVDASGSVRRLFDPGVDAAGNPAQLSDRIARFLETASGPADSAASRRADDLSAVILYDAEPTVLGALEARSPAPFLPAPIPPPSESAPDGTNTAAALRLAAALAPPDAATRIVLFSDGNDTTGDAVSAARALRRAPAAPATPSTDPGIPGALDSSPARSTRIPIDVVPLEYRTPREVEVESCEAPSLAPGESTVQLRITLLATEPATGDLHVSREGEPIDASPDQPGLARRMTLPAGRTTVRIPVRLPPGRVHRFTARFDPLDPAADRIPDNNRAQAVSLTPGRSSVLIIDGVSGGDTAAAGGALARTLRAGGLEVESLPPGAVPNDPLFMQRYDLVVLQNVAADALNDGVAQTLAAYVTDQGGGLVMIGGPDSFGAGGWKGTPIEPVLPVRLDLPEQLISPAAAVVIVIDCSGSMGFRVSGSSRSKQAIANDGAAIAVESMDKTDLIGVIAFNNDFDVLIPLGPNQDPKAAGRTIRSIRADGGTNLPPALGAAVSQLRTAKADVKHIIVLSDGRSQNLEQIPGIVAAAKKDDIRVSTIAVGDEADVQTMARMAESGGGAYYRVLDPNLLPRIFIKAIRVVRSPLVRETPFVPRVLATGSPLLEGLDQPLSLNGLVLTQAREDPTVTYAMATPTGEPLLAHWNAGVGRVAAFTSDAHHWAAPWLGGASGAPWPGYARLWLQVARTIARPQPDRAQELAVDLDGDDAVVRLAARDSAGKPLDNLAVGGTLHGPGNTRLPLRLAQVGAGEYQARIPAAAAGSYVVTLTPRANGRPLPPVVGGVARSGGAEFRRLESNADALRRLALESGGRVLSLDNPAEARLFDRAAMHRAVARRAIWRPLLIAGLALLVLDTASRRIAWDRFYGREFGARRRRRAEAAAAARAQRAAATVERLRQREAAVEAREHVEAGPAKLSTDDARAIIRDQAERRRQSREAARRAVPAPSVETAPPPAAPTQQTPMPADPGAEPRTSSLLEAKRRARRQLEDLDTDPDGAGS